ncbi:MAG: 2-C-methyl-D-erythritol 4-phosphate cytidylyltransferase [Candidatus Dormibacteria bacterium]
MLPAFGRGSRMGADKLWSDLGGKPLIGVTLDAVAAAQCFDDVLVLAPRPRWDEIRALMDARGITAGQLAEGGDRRQDSVARALQHIGQADIVCVHDGARPLASPELFRRVVAAAREHGAATCGVPCTDTVKEVENGRVVRTLTRERLIATQTPQAFEAELLRRAHEAASEEQAQADDDALLVERLGVDVAVVPGEPRNIKVTYPDDLTAVRAFLGTT